MVEEIKNIIFAGIGSATLSYEKASEIIDVLVKKGQLTFNQGKDLAEELKRTIKEDANEVVDKAPPITLDAIYELLRTTNFNTMEEIKRLENRISELEDRITN